MKVLSIGFGFVGKAYAIYARESGHDVAVFTVKDKTHDEAINYNFREPSPGEKFDAAIIAVPTPTENGKFISSILEEAVNKAVKQYPSKNIFIKSTLVIGLTRKLSELYPESEFYFYPEFLEAKNPIGGVFNQKIKVFGSGNWTDTKKKFINELFKLGNFDTTDFETAESIKYMHNIWLSCNISFWNAAMRTCKGNVNFDFVLEQVHKSDYFGRHPWAIGKEYDGACLPKDIGAYLSQISENTAYKKFFEAVEEVNNSVIEDAKEKAIV